MSLIIDSLRLSKGPLTKTLFDSFGAATTNRQQLVETVAPARLWDTLLECRYRGQIRGEISQGITKTITALDQVGFEDPLAVSDRMKQHTARLLERYQPQTELDKALLIFRSVLPAGRVFSWQGEKYRALSVAEGGLNLDKEIVISSKQRKQHGCFLPEYLISGSRAGKKAICFEYSALLLGLLRSAGLMAHIKGEPGHAFTVIVIDGRRYKLDALNPTFELYKGDFNTDREIIVMHYINKSGIFFKLGLVRRALKYVRQALEIDPDDYLAWAIRGSIFAFQHRTDQALRCFNKSLRLRPGNYEANFQKAVYYLKALDLKQALRYINKALETRPNEQEACQLKADILKIFARLEVERGDWTRALFYAEKARLARPSDPETKRLCLTLIRRLVRDSNEAGLLSQALSYLDQALLVAADKTDLRELFLQKYLLLLTMDRQNEARNCWQEYLQLCDAGLTD